MYGVHLWAKKTPDSLNYFRDYLEDVRCMMEEGRCE
jgi:hypothetical protein